jgi:hypothetical protein
MAITPFPDPAPADAAGVVAAACAGIVGVAEALWSARGDDELVAGVEEIQQLKAKTAALEASLLAEIDAREIPRKQLAWGSTAVHARGGRHPRRGQVDDQARPGSRR